LLYFSECAQYLLMENSRVVRVRRCRCGALFFASHVKRRFFPPPPGLKESCCGRLFRMPILRKRWKKVLLCSTLCLLCSFLFVTPVRASRAAKYQGSAAQRLLTAPESVSRFRVRLSENPVLQAAVQRSAV